MIHRLAKIVKRGIHIVTLLARTTKIGKSNTKTNGKRLWQSTKPSVILFQARLDNARNIVGKF